MHLIYGILEKPSPSLQAINVSALLQKGVQRVQLLKPKIKVPPLPGDLKTMEIRVPDVTIPRQETTYWCFMTELPDGFEKHHIVMVSRRTGPHLPLFFLSSKIILLSLCSFCLSGGGEAFCLCRGGISPSWDSALSQHAE